MPLSGGNPFETVEDVINSWAPSGHWPITELSGTTIKDISGNGRDGTLSGTITLNNTTAPDGRPAALFGGGVITIPSVTQFAVDATYGMTVGAFVKFDSIPSITRFIMAKGQTGPAKYEWDFACINTGGNGQFGLFLNTAAGSGLAARYTTRSPIDTNWCLLAGRVQNRLVVASNQIDIWKNSIIPVQDATNAGTVSPYTYDATVPVAIGVRPGDPTMYTNGYIRNAFIVPEAIDRGAVGRLILAAQREGWDI